MPAGKEVKESPQVRRVGGREKGTDGRTAEATLDILVPYCKP